MLVLMEQGFGKEEMIRLNWVRCHQQSLFLSDVFDAGGQALNQRYLTRRPTDKAWSTLLFPRESPLVRNFYLWRQALSLLAPRGVASHWLGCFTGKGHKIWGWRLDQQSNCLYKLGGATMDVYLPSTTDGRTRRTHPWSLEQRGVPSAKQGLVCTVSNHGSVRR